MHQRQKLRKDKREFENRPKERFKDIYNRIQQVQEHMPEKKQVSECCHMSE